GEIIYRTTEGERAFAPGDRIMFRENNRELHLEAEASASPLGACFVKQFGMYPPGTLVRLKTGETALVVRRGAKVNAPLALAITGPDGMLLSIPVKRDTQLPLYAITAPVAPEDLRIRLDLARLLKRI
ncbi:MAG: hypothetical protein B7X56_03835, partial [Burkholderiales bacterium 34-67-9]